MNDIKALCALQQFHEKGLGEVKVYQPLIDHLETVLRLACKGAGVEYPQTGFRGVIEFE